MPDKNAGLAFNQFLKAKDDLAGTCHPTPFIMVTYWCHPGQFTPSQTTNFRRSQTERVCRRNFKFNENGRKNSPYGKRTLWGKRRNCSLRAISPVFTVFSKHLTSGHVKIMACLGKY